MRVLQKLRRDVKRLLAVRLNESPRWEVYRNDPALFAAEVLGQVWTPKQIEIAESLLKPPYRTLVKASHNVGKTMLAGGVVLWWHLTRQPSVIITTAPKYDQVKNLLWKEIRRQAMEKKDEKASFRFGGPAIPRLERAVNDYAMGTTARSGTSFQGHHSESMLFVFDEAIGVDGEFWRVTKTMFKPELGHAWLCIFNPTDTTTTAYLEEQAIDRNGKPLWNVITMSALDHPNILAELDRKPAPIPAAISLAQLEEGLGEDCKPVAGEPLATDILWRGKWLRPGPIAESRWLGRWPSQGTYGVWSDADWQAASALILPEPLGRLPEIGCDVARFGDDWTVIHVRCGPVSLHHEAANGWSTAETAGRLKQLCREYADWWNARHPAHQPVTGEDIPVKIDDDGVGGGVTDQAGDYTFIAVSAASVCPEPDGYPNLRSYLWFAAAQRARMGRMALGKLPADVKHRLRQQVMAPVWKLDAAGRRVVEKKDDTKTKLGRSPDDADALALCYHEVPAFKAASVPNSERRPLEPSHQTAAARRGLYGR